MERVKTDNDKINIALKLFERTYNEACAVSVADSVKALRAIEAVAVEAERKRQEEAKMLELRGHLSTVEKVRETARSAVISWWRHAIPLPTYPPLCDSTSPLSAVWTV